MIKDIFCCFSYKEKSENEEDVNELERVDMQQLRRKWDENVHQKIYDELQDTKKKHEETKNLHNEQLDQKEQEHKKMLAYKDQQLEEFEVHNKKQNERYIKEEGAMKHSKENWLDISKDFNTIAGQINNATGNLKASYNPNKLLIEDIITLFQQCWTEELGYDNKRREDTIRKVNELFQGKTLKNSYAVVSVFVEKLISDYLVTRVYLAPTHVGFDKANEVYEYLNDLLPEDDIDFLKKLRIRMVGNLSERAEKDEEYKMTVKNSVANLVNEIATSLDKIYKRKPLETQIKRIVVAAVKLSFPIHGQRNHIIVHNLETDKELFTNQVEQHLLSTSNNSNMVSLGIHPVIYASKPEKDNAASGKKQKVESKDNEEEDHNNNDDDENDGSESESESESDDDSSSSESDDDDTPKKVTRKGKKKKEKKIENIGSYLNEDFIFRGTAIGYEQR